MDPLLQNVSIKYSTSFYDNLEEGELSLSKDEAIIAIPVEPEEI